MFPIDGQIATARNVAIPRAFTAHQTRLHPAPLTCADRRRFAGRPVRLRRWRSTRSRSTTRASSTPPLRRSGKGGPDAVIVQPSLPTKRAAQLALDYRMPAGCTLHAFVDEGGLMSYWFAEVDLYERAAAIVDKVLKGTAPADIPIEQPTKFELALNLKTAKTL